MANPLSTHVLLITGTVGVGKTSVADATFELLAKQSQSVALINLDELGYISPRPSDDPFNTQLRFKNLGAIWSNYQKAGTSSVIIPWVIESNDELARFRKAIPNAQFFVIRLDAPTATVERRIRERPMGGSLEWHLKRAAELTSILAQAGVEDLVVDTENKTIAEIANGIVAAWSNHAK